VRRAPTLLALALLNATGVAAPRIAAAQSPASDVTVVLANGGLGLTVFAAAYLGPGSTTSVLVGVEVTNLARAAVPPNGLPRQLEVRLLADTGSRAPTERVVAVPLIERETLTRAAQDGIRILTRMALPPGHHALRIVARDSGDGASVSVVHNVDVPNLVEAPITMSNLVISSSTVGGVTQAEIEEDGSLPILARPPTGRRQFSRGERIEVSAEIYDAVERTVPDDDFESLSVATTVIAPDGRIAYESVDDGASEPLESGAYGYRHYALVPIETLPPGPYVVRVAALLNGVVSASQSVPITVAASN